VRFGAALEPAAVAAVAEPEFAGALRAACGAALGLPPEAVLIAGVFDVRTGALTAFRSTDDVNVAGNREDAGAVADALLGGGGRRGRALQASPAAGAAATSAAELSFAGLVPKRNASSAAVAVFFNALAPCPAPCGGAQNAAAASALRANVLATAADAALQVAAVLPPGVAWTLNAAVVIPFSITRVKTWWQQRASPAAPEQRLSVLELVGVVVGSVIAVAMLAALMWRCCAQIKGAKVRPEAEPPFERREEEEGEVEAGLGGYYAPAPQRHPSPAPTPARNRSAWNEEEEGEQAWGDAGSRVYHAPPLPRSRAQEDEDFLPPQLAPTNRRGLNMDAPQKALSPRRAPGAVALRGQPHALAQAGRPPLRERISPRFSPLAEAGEAVAASWRPAPPNAGGRSAVPWPEDGGGDFAAAARGGGGGPRAQPASREPGAQVDAHGGGGAAGPDAALLEIDSPVARNARRVQAESGARQQRRGGARGSGRRAE